MGGEILQGQRLVDSLVVVEAKAHHQGCQRNPAKGGEQAGQGDPEAEQGNGKRGQAMLANHQHDIDGGEGEKTGNFADGLDQTDMHPFQLHRLHRVVVDQDGIALQSRHGRSREHGQKAKHRLVDGGEHHASPRCWAPCSGPGKCSVIRGNSPQSSRRQRCASAISGATAMPR